MIAAYDWWKRADTIELAIVDALDWIGPMTAADLTRTFEGAIHPVFVLTRLKHLLSVGVVEAVDARRVRGVTVRRYQVAREER